MSDDEKAEVKKLHDDDKQKARERITEILEVGTSNTINGERLNSGLDWRKKGERDRQFASSLSGAHC